MNVDDAVMLSAAMRSVIYETQQLDMSRHADPAASDREFNDPSSSRPSRTLSPSLKQRIAEHLYTSVSGDEEHKRAKRQAQQRDSAARGGVAVSMTASNRPNFLVCYLCGQQFSRNSLSIHQPQCYVKKLIEWERGGVGGARGAKPIPPEEMHATLFAGGESEGSGRVVASSMAALSARDVEVYNERQSTTFNETALVPCENCGRTFFPDRLVVHQRSCKPDRAAKPVTARRSTSPCVLTPPPASPLLRGNSERESRSISDSVHIRPSPHGSPVIQSSSRASQGLLPPSKDEDDAGDARPRTGSSFEPTRAVGNEDGDEEGDDLTTSTITIQPRRTIPVNDTSVFKNVSSRFRSASDVTALVRCKHCHRTFAPNRVAKHEDVCLEKREKEKAAAAAASSHRNVSAAVKPKHAIPAGGGPSVLANTSFGMTSSRAHVSVSPGASSSSYAREDIRSPNGVLRAGSGLGTPSSSRGSPVVELPPAGANSFHNNCDGASGVGGGGGGGGERTTPIPLHPVPKFCTECGHKLYSSTQKFCGECGSRIVQISSMLVAPEVLNL